MTFSNGSSTWTASTDAPWLQITNGSGARCRLVQRHGQGRDLRAVHSDGDDHGERRQRPQFTTQIPVTLRVFTAGGNPSGVVDTPADNITGVTGAIAVTGWAIDDIDIQEVGIWRDPIAGETASSANGKVFIGRAAFVDGARPDVDAAITSRSTTRRAGATCC